MKNQLRYKEINIDMLDLTARACSRSSTDCNSRCWQRRLSNGQGNRSAVAQRRRHVLGIVRKRNFLESEMDLNWLQLISRRKPISNQKLMQSGKRAPDKQLTSTCFGTYVINAFPESSIYV